MTAIPSHASAAPPAERRSDPSMEDVLASIRKIIADEDAAHSRPPIDPVATVPSPRPVPLPANPTPSASILTPQAAGGRSWGAAPPPPIPRPSQPFSFSRPAPAPAPPVATVAPVVEPMFTEPQVAEAPPVLAMDEPEPSVGIAPSTGLPAEVGALLSTATTDSISSAFQALTASVALTKTEVIDRHVRDLLRPMLRTWLDDNLPGIVEKLVRLEIERVARGGR